MPRTHNTFFGKGLSMQNTIEHGAVEESDLVQNAGTSLLCYLILLQNIQLKI